MATIKLSQEQGDFKNVQPSLTPLQCQACGVSVPLVDAEQSKCVSCSTLVTVPQEYRQLHKMQEEQRKNLQHAKDAHELLLNPPSTIEKIWHSLASGIFSIIGIIIALSIILCGLMSVTLVFMLYFAVSTFAPDWGVNYNDTLGVGWVYFIFFTGLSLVMILPMVLYSNVKKHTDLKKTLQASMASKIEIHKGTETATHSCRNCGAGLSLSATDIATVCDYCGAENLVNLPPSWVQSITQSAKWHFKTIAEGVNLAKTYALEHKKSLRNWFIGTAFLIPFAWCMGHLVKWGESNGETFKVPSWKEVYSANGADRKMVADQYESNSAPAIPINQWTVPTHKAYWLTLEAGEILVIQYQTKFSEDVFSLVHSSTAFEGAFVSEALVFDTSATASFIAPYKGLFEFVVPEMSSPAALKWTTVQAKKYEEKSAYYEGLAAVRIGDKWGFIDRTGKEVIPLQYDYVLYFENGKASVTLNGKDIFIDATGNEVKQ